MEEQVANSLKFIYNHNFEKARETFTKLNDEQLQQVLEVFCMRWEEVPIQRSNKKSLYLSKLEAVVKAFKKEDSSKHPSSIYLHISTQLLLAEYHFLNRDFFQALFHGKKAYPLMMQSFDGGRTEPEFLFVKGLYLYYIEYYRNKGFHYRTALWPFRDGDMDEGLRLIKESASISSLAQTEALIYAAHISFRLEGKPLEGLEYSQKLTEQYPDNPKFRELYLENLLAAGKYEACADLLSMQLSIENPYYRIPALYFLGCMQMNFYRNNEGAKKTFRECIKLSKENSLLEEYREKAEDKLTELN
jgi:hypothetical protein